MPGTNWKQRIDKVTQFVNDNFSALTFEELNWKPNSKSWSIGQVIDHLIVSNNSYFPQIMMSINGKTNTAITAKIPVVPELFGKLLLKFVNPQSKKKVKTFSVFEPSLSNINLSIINEFEKNNDELKKIIQNTSSFINKGIIVSSPVNKLIVFKLETVFEILVSHEERHFLQAQKVRNAIPTELLH